MNYAKISTPYTEESKTIIDLNQVKMVTDFMVPRERNPNIGFGEALPISHYSACPDGAKAAIIMYDKDIVFTDLTVDEVYGLLV